MLVANARHRVVGSIASLRLWRLALSSLVGVTADFRLVFLGVFGLIGVWPFGE